MPTLSAYANGQARFIIIKDFEQPQFTTQLAGFAHRDKFDNVNFSHNLYLWSPDGITFHVLLRGSHHSKEIVDFLTCQPGLINQAKPTENCFIYKSNDCIYIIDSEIKKRSISDEWKDFLKQAFKLAFPIKLIKDTQKNQNLKPFHRLIISSS